MRKVLGAAFLFVLAMLGGPVQAHPAQSEWRGRTVWDEVYFHAQADRGEVHFLTHCAKCHDGSPGGPIRLSSEEFFNRWREETLAALFTYIKTKMPADEPGSLGEWDYLDIVTYIMQLNHFPAGESDLLMPHLRGVLLVGVDGYKPLAAGTPVYVVGCLNQAANGWILTSSTPPARSRNLPETDAVFKTLETQPLGSETVKLEGVVDAEGKGGARVFTNGVLTHHNGQFGIDASDIRVLSPVCQPSATPRLDD